MGGDDDSDGKDKAEERLERWVVRYVMYPIVACLILGVFHVPYVEYVWNVITFILPAVIPAVILGGVLYTGLTVPFGSKGIGVRIVSFLFGLCIAYGGFAFFFPGMLAARIAPEHWEWPAGRTVSALSLPRGEWAVLVRYPLRVQIYDNDSNYLRGWFVPNNGGTSPVMIGLPPLTADVREDLEGITVNVSNGDKEFIYDLKGKLLSEKIVDYQSVAQRGEFAERRLAIKWYERPLTHPIYAWCLGAVGVAGLKLIEYLEKRNTRRRSMDEDAKPVLPAAKKFDREARERAKRNTDNRTNRGKFAFTLIALYEIGYLALSATLGLRPTPWLLLLPPVLIAFLVAKYGKVHQPFASAQKWLAEGRFDKAVPELYEAEENKHVGAAVLLGDIYLKGEYVAAGRPLAAEHYPKAFYNYGDLQLASAMIARKNTWAERLTWGAPLREQTIDEADGWLDRMAGTLQTEAEGGEVWAVRLLVGMHSSKWKHADAGKGASHARVLVERSDAVDDLVRAGQLLAGRREAAFRDDMNLGMELLEKALGLGSVDAGRYLLDGYFGCSCEFGEPDPEHGRATLDRFLALPVDPKDDAVGYFAQYLCRHLLESGQEKTLSPAQIRLLDAQVGQGPNGDIRERWAALLRR